MIDVLPDHTDAEPEIPTLSLSDISALMASARTALSRIQEIELTAEMERSRIDTWVENATATDRKHVAYVEAQCETFMRARIKDAHKSDRKSVTTPFGTIATRRQEPDYVRDDSVLLPWCRDHGYLRPPKPQTETIAWDRLRSALGILGNGGVFVRDHEGTERVVPGITVAPREPSVVVAIDNR